ncbi:MAG: hypothetical protein RLP12_03510 [Ekhidna sp.]
MTIYTFFTRFFNKKIAGFLTAITYLIMLLIIWYFIGVEEGDFRYLNY